MFGTSRFDRLMQAVEQRHEQLREESERRYRDELQITREVIRRNELAFQEGYRVMAELAEETRAQTRAIFQVLDRLENGGAAAS